MLSVELVFTRFPISPVSKIQILIPACGADLENEFFRSGSVQSVSTTPVEAQSTSSIVVELNLLPPQFPPRNLKMRRDVARGGACVCERASILSPGLTLAAPHAAGKKASLMTNFVIALQIQRYNVTNTGHKDRTYWKMRHAYNFFSITIYRSMKTGCRETTYLRRNDREVVLKLMVAFKES